MEKELKILRKDSSGKVIEEINIDPKDIKDNKIEIGYYGDRFIGKVKIVETPYEVKVPKFVEKEVIVEKVKIIEKNIIVEKPIYVNKEIVVKNVKVVEEKKKIPVYEFEYIKMKIPVIEEHPVKVPKIVEEKIIVPKLVEKETIWPRVVYKDLILTNPILNEKTVDTCIINHICPHCGKKSVGFMDNKSSKKK